MKRFIAFTLSEVLITVAVIGVVSAMTIPTLMKNYQRQVYVTSLKKSYTELQQGFKNAMTDNNAVNLLETKLFRNNKSENFLSAYFNVTQSCNAGNTSCLADTYKTFTGTTISPATIVGTGDGATLANGSSLYILPSNNGSSGMAVIDINGKQGPNIPGRDLFTFTYDNTGKAVIISPENLAEALTTAQTSDSGAEAYAAFFSKIINDGWEMKY